VLIGGTLGAAAVILFLTTLYPPASPEHVHGAIAKRDVYRDGQGAAQAGQSGEFQKLYALGQFKSFMSSSKFKGIAATSEFGRLLLCRRPSPSFPRPPPSSKQAAGQPSSRNRRRRSPRRRRSSRRTRTRPG